MLPRMYIVYCNIIDKREDPYHLYANYKQRVILSSKAYYNDAIKRNSCKLSTIWLNFPLRLA